MIERSNAEDRDSDGDHRQQRNDSNDFGENTKLSEDCHESLSTSERPPEGAASRLLMEVKFEQIA
jgi:hypothetical protein